MKFFKSVLIAVFLSLLAFTAAIGTVLYFAIEGRISFWWLAMSIPAWILIESVIAIYAFGKFGQCAEEMHNDFDKRAEKMHERFNR